jgi:hypothetical protein
MADATPPVALAAFAASGISGGDPFLTGVQGFYYELRTAILPFVFLYNPEILLLNIRGPLQLVWVLGTAVLACICFACATQAYMFTRVRPGEIVLLLSAALFLFRPDIMHDRVYPPFKTLPPDKIEEVIAALEPGDNMRLALRTEFGDGKVKERVLVMPFSGNTAEKRLESVGIALAEKDGALMIDDVSVNSRAEKLGVSMDDPTWVIGIETPAERPDKGLFALPGLFVMGAVVLNQLRRRRREAGAA